MILTVGDTIKVSHRIYKGGYYVYKIVDTDSKDCFGRFCLSILEESMPNGRTKKWEEGEYLMYTEDDWFNEELTGRKIIKL